MSSHDSTAACAAEPAVQPAPASARLSCHDMGLLGRERPSERVAKHMLQAMAVLAAASVLLVAFFVLRVGVPALFEQGWSFVSQGGWDYDLATAWESSTSTAFGARPLIAGTVLTTLLALVVCATFGMGTAVFVAELAPRSIRAPIEALVQLLAGIPSVVFGLVGVAVVVPWVTDHVVPSDAWETVPNIPIDGASLLSAVLVLSLMIMPFFVSVAVDTLRAVPRSYTAGGLALGLTKWRTISKIQIPAAFPGLVAGLVLAAARGIGEAIAISMVAGSLALTPGLENGPLYFLLTPVRTMASTIVETGGEAMSLDSIEGALFGLATLLLLFSLVLSVAARASFSWFARKTALTRN